MSPNEVISKLKEIRIIVNSDLPINYDIKVLYKTYQDLLDRVIAISREANKLPKTLAIQVLSIADLKEKEFITAKEFEKLYSYGVSWQKDRRSRINNPLPTVSSYRMKILYDHKTIKSWLENEIFK